MYQHEHVIITNSGLRDERVTFTGDVERFSTREAAQASADHLNKLYDLGLYVREQPATSSYLNRKPRTIEQAQADIDAES